MRNLFKIHFGPDRIYGLDILRAIAILVVVIEHGMRLLPKELNKVYKLVAIDGVSIFFVLSGYLIGGIMIRLLEKRTLNPRLLGEFWVRRWMRTVPNYILVLLVLTVVYIFTQNDPTFSPGSYFIFSQNLYYPHPSFFIEAWSLSVEEWFYLLTPLIIFGFILFLKWSPRRSVLMAVIVVIGLVTGFRLLRYFHIHLDDETQWNLVFRTQVITRLDSIMFGVIGAYLSFYHPAKWTMHKRRLLYLGILLFIGAKLIYHLLPVTGLFNCVFSFSLTSLATLCLLPFLSELKRGEGVFYNMFTCVSLISYSMYLLNFSVVQNCILNKLGLEYLTANLYVNGLLKYMLYWFLTVTLSILLYKYFEVPVLEWRNRLTARKNQEEASLLVPEEH